MSSAPSSSNHGTSKSSRLDFWFNTGDRYESPAQARSRRLTAIGIALPAIVASVVLAASRPDELAGIPESFAAAFVAVASGMLIESRGRGVVLLLLGAVIFGGTAAVLAKGEFSDEARTLWLTGMFAAGGGLVGIRDIVRSMGASRTFLPSATPRTAGSCTLVRCETCERPLCRELLSNR